MPKITVTHGAGNQSLATLLGSQAPATGWVKGLDIQAASGNTGDVKVGSSSMTSTDYDAILSGGDSENDSSSEGLVLLNTRYVRNDHATDDQTLYVRFEMT